MRFQPPNSRGGRTASSVNRKRARGSTDTRYHVHVVWVEAQHADRFNPFYKALEAAAPGAGIDAGFLIPEDSDGLVQMVVESARGIPRATLEQAASGQGFEIIEIEYNRLGPRRE